MEILSGLEALPDPRIRNPIVTWGVFDGVHRGHRKVLETVLGWARAEGVSAVAATFDRHPAQVLTGKPVPLVSPLGERLRLMGEIGLDFCLVINFTVEFSKTSAEAFLGRIVKGGLGARGVVLGHDSRFGRDRAGDLDLLARVGRDLGLEVRNCDPERYRGRPISSSLIREAIAAGSLEEAHFLLGRAPSVIGTVVRGERRGEKLGFPTANLDLESTVRPPRGVYAAEVPLGGKTYPAVVNIGVRPTFEAGTREVLEVHLLDFAGGDLYGRVMEVRLHGRIREERKFPDAEALKRQIRSDVEFVREKAGRPAAARKGP